jgi:hypothetical protein
LDGYRSARARRRRGAVVGAGLLALAGLAGWAAVELGGPMGVLLGVLAVACLGVAWLIRPRRDPERWRRGAAGEVATARLLDRLPGGRWVVLHDLRIPGSRANVDHLVIGPTGVWVIDTKTTRARVRAGWRLVRFGDRPLDPGPTMWEAQVVADRLGTRVRPVIAVHGRGLRRRGARCGQVRVLSATRLVRHLRRGRRRLDRDRIADLAERAGRVFFLEKASYG